MKKAIVFLETYHAAGSDKVAKSIYENLEYDEIDLFVNKGVDARILNFENIPKHVNVHYYSLFTPSNLSLLASRQKNLLIKFIIRFINLLIRYPLIAVSIPYFYLKFINIKFDVFISINGGYPAAEYCRSACVSASMLIKSNIFHIFFNKPAKSFLFFSIIEKYYDKYLDRHVQFICDSSVNAKILNDVRNINQNVKVVHNGLPIVPQKSYSLDPSKIFVMLNIAIFEDRKNQLLLIEMIADLVNDGYTNILLKLVGYETQAGYLDRMNRLIKKYNLKKYILIYEFTTDLESFYRDSDIFLLSSKGESFPIVILEALRYGLPIISTNVGDVSKQIKSHYNGFLIEDFNKKDMAEKVKYLMDHRDKCMHFGNNSYNHFLNYFSLDEMIIQYKKIIGKLA